MRSHARVVIIGGGVIGCSVAYHITKLGWSDVVLIERNELTSGSTWHAAGQCTHYAETLFLARSYKDSFALYGGLEAETGLPVGVHRTGGVRLARTRDGVEEFKRYLNLARTAGIDAEIVGPNRVRELWPLLETNQFLAGLHTKEEGWVDPTQTTNALAKAARDRGAEINRHTRVTGLSQMPSGEWRVETDKGVIAAEYVVNAAGCWGAEISAMLGHYLPVLAKEHQYLVTEPAPQLKGLSVELPVLRDYSVPLYARQEGQGLMISGYEHKVKFRWLDGAPKDFANELFPPDLERAEPCLEETYRMIPALETLGIRTVVNGPIPGTPDLMALVGPAHGLRNYFVCCGVYGGFVQGAVARYLAEWIVEGEPSVDVSDVDVRRFGGFATKDYLVSRLTAGHMWSSFASYPETEAVVGARPVRTSALHATLAAKGAVFGVINGWEVPNWFAPAGVAREDKPSFSRANWFEPVGAECRAVRAAAGVFDHSSLAKFEVAGEGAERFLDGLSAHALPGQGQRAHCAFLHPSGGIAFLVAIDRLAGNQFALAVPGTAEQALADWLKDRAPATGVAIANTTDSEAVLVLAGPQSGAILDAAAADPVSTTAHRRVVSTTIGSTPVRIVRTDDIDASAWEIRCRSTQLLPLYEALWRHGEARGLKDFGRRAHDSLRIERDIPRCGVDFGVETSLAAAALPLPRQGRATTGAAGNGAPRRNGAKLVRLAIDDTVPTNPWGGEVIEASGQQVGYVTSGAYGHTAKKNLAFARVAPMHAAPGTTLDVVVFGERYKAAVLAADEGRTA
ncbi:MAG: FAD-dependent oxidoreductase [Alphaproteobacteria bacterium]